MDAIDRRSALRGLLCGVVAAGLGAGLVANPVEAMPLAMEKHLGAKTDNLREKAEPVQMGPPGRPIHRPPRRPIHRHRWHRHRRPRRVCWWHRGRRVCRWR
ncbi:twin-arginine translocation signal domain-containing protein [Bradyrhizobium murdochi]|uniref:twin-arginine translocation signal domain-containing protein n=1 Tax=Bradyrhizobium murdochi TaxID=1038859 RepID=UPI0012ECB88A